MDVLLMSVPSLPLPALPWVGWVAVPLDRGPPGAAWEAAFDVACFCCDAGCEPFKRFALTLLECASAPCTRLSSDCKAFEARDAILLPGAVGLPPWFARFCDDSPGLGP